MSILSQKYKDWQFIQGEEHKEQSDDLINRDAVIYYIKGHIHEIITESGEDKNAHTNRVLRALINGVETMPPVKPQEPTDTWSIKDVADTLARHGLIVEQEPKTGHWYYDEEREATGIYAICSNCDETIYQTGDFKYCPNCGARMVEGSDTEWHLQRKEIRHL